MSYLSRLTQLRCATNSLFAETIKTAKSIDKDVEKYLYNSRINRLLMFSNKEYNYIGEDKCGIMSYALKQNLLKVYPHQQFNLKITKKKYENSDHVFITTSLHGKEVIIDPTWRQFFVNHKAETIYQDGHFHYPYYLYMRYQPFFVGDRIDLHHMIDDLYRVDAIVNTDYTGLAPKEESIQWWENSTPFVPHI